MGCNLSSQATDGRSVAGSLENHTSKLSRTDVSFFATSSPMQCPRDRDAFVLPKSEEMERDDSHKLSVASTPISSPGFIENPASSMEHTSSRNNSDWNGDECVDNVSVGDLIENARSVELQESLNSLTNTTVDVTYLKNFVRTHGVSVLHQIIQTFIHDGALDVDRLVPQSSGVRESLFMHLNALDKHLIANFGLLMEDFSPSHLNLLLQNTESLDAQQRFVITVNTVSEEQKLVAENLDQNTAALLRSRKVEIEGNASSSSVISIEETSTEQEVRSSVSVVEPTGSNETDKADGAAQKIVLHLLPGMQLSRVILKGDQPKDLELRHFAISHAFLQEANIVSGSGGFPKIFFFSTKAQTIRDSLYGANSRIPVLEKPKRAPVHFAEQTAKELSWQVRNTCDQQSRANGGNTAPVASEYSALRRQFLSERASQIQAAYKCHELQQEMSRVDILADTGACKAIWTRWVDELGRKIEKMRKSESTKPTPTAAEKSDDSQDDESFCLEDDYVSEEMPKIDAMNEILARVVPNTMSSDLLAVITCRTAFSVLYQPRKDDPNLPNVAGAIGFAHKKPGSEEDIQKKATAFKNVKVLSGNDVRSAGDSLQIPFVEMCTKIGDAINFEFNCMEIDEKTHELNETQEEFSQKETSAKTRKQYLMKMKLLTEPVWDKLSVRIPLGSALAALLLESCPVMCDFHDAKAFLSEEQRQSWIAQHQRMSVALVNSQRNELEEGAGDVSSMVVRQRLDYDGMLKSEEDYEKVELNALYHRLIWRKDGKMQGQIVMREICRKVLDEAGFVGMVKPVNPPMLTVPRPWLGPRLGCYLLHPVRLIRNTGSPRTIDDARTYDMTNVQNALNGVGAVPWRINQQTFDLIEHVWERELEYGKVPPKKDVDVQALVRTEEEWEEMTEEEQRLNFLEIVNAKKANARLASERPTFLLRLQAAKEHYHALKIYFPHSVDFRGRAYPVPPHLNHQGPDICRGLLEFAETKPLGERGLYWMKIQLANLAGKDKLTLDKRVEWCDEHTEKIRATARDPLNPEHIDFWSEADDGPWQFLACCFHYEAALSDPRGPELHESRCSVHMDGSCNGLQHYAALGLDPEGGRAVNVLANEVPQDVYSIVLAVVRRKVEAAAAGGDETAQACIDLGTLKRSTVKQTVMTICYGVTMLGAQRQVQKHLEDQLGSSIEPGKIKVMGTYLARLTLKSVDEVFERAMGIKKWLDCVSELFSKCNVPVSWMTPLGLAVTQPYYGETGKRVETSLQSVTLRFKNADGKVDGRQQKCGFPPNFVHSLDASHMMMVATAMAQEGMRFAAVHDSFWTHPGDVDRMNYFIREKFVELHSKPILDELESDFRLMLGEEKGHLLPPLPPRADMNLGDVRRSKYFFD